VFWIALAVNVAIAVTTRYFPFEDTTNDLARYVLLDRAWFAHGVGVPSTIVVSAQPGPYLGFDVIGAVIVHVFGPDVGARIIAAITVIAIPLGFALLLRAIGGHARRWAIVGVPFGFGFFTHAGFLSYVVGLGVGFAFLSYWWPRRREPTLVAALGLTAGIIGCYLMHLSAVLMVLVVIWVDALAARDRRVWLALWLSAAVGVMYLWTTIGAPPLPAEKPAPFALGGLWWKTKNTLAPFYAYSAWQALPMIGAYVLAVVMYWRENQWQNKPQTTLGLAAVAFFGLYAFFPQIGTGGGYVDQRWLIPAYLLVFCASTATKGPSSRGLRWLVTGSIVSSIVLLPTIWRINRYLDDYATMLGRLEPGKSVFPIVADDRRFGGRVIPYRHFAFWYTIRFHGNVPSLFDYSGDGMETNWFMPYFDDTAHRYAPPIGWFGGGGRLRPLNWQRITAENDYVIVAGRDSAMRAEVAGHARCSTEVGEIILCNLR
jgi:hypothetical protein